MNYFDQIGNAIKGGPVDGRFARSRIASQITRGFMDQETSRLVKTHTEYSERIAKNPELTESLQDQFNALIHFTRSPRG